MSRELSNGFGDFGGRAWLNTAHQGALPRVAGDEAREAARWKMAPHELTPERFRSVPERLRRAIGRLIGVPPEEVILANSASYGLHLVAHAYPWTDGDEVLVVAGDFPSNILPWLVLEERSGVRVRRLRPADRVATPSEVAGAITPRTRLFCATWVDSFSGRSLEVDEIGRVCRDRDVIFLLNASQGLGAAPLAAAAAPIDGLTCTGFKWLCGPYGTGFCWLRNALRERLRRTQAYWLAMQSQEELGEPVGDVALRSPLGAADFDVFGTANFLNFKPLAAAIELLLEIGIERVRAHDQALVTRFIEGLPVDYRLLSPRADRFRSTLIFFSHCEAERNRELHAALAARGIDIALRNGAMRASPHLYNSSADIDRLLSALDSYPRSR